LQRLEELFASLPRTLVSQLGIISYLTLGLEINNRQSYSQYTRLVTSENGIVQLWPLQGYQLQESNQFEKISNGHVLQSNLQEDIKAIDI
jgi:hypothetical protein